MKSDLLNLRKRISSECFISKWKWKDFGLKEVWFFPEYNDVKGYLGTDKIVFIALNPSFGRFPSEGDKLLYRNLKKHGFHNAHLTDIIKLRLTRKQYNGIKKTNKKLYFEILEKHINWLKQELKIIDKNLNVKIVSIGDESYKILKKYFEEKVLEKRLPHYSWVVSYSKEKQNSKRAIFRKMMVQIAYELNKN